MLSTGRKSIILSSCSTVKDKGRVISSLTTEMTCSFSFRNHFHQHDYFADQYLVKQLLTFVFGKQHQIGKSIYFDSDNSFLHLGVYAQRHGCSTQLGSDKPTSHSQPESIAAGMLMLFMRSTLCPLFLADPFEHRRFGSRSRIKVNYSLFTSDISR